MSYIEEGLKTEVGEGLIVAARVRSQQLESSDCIDNIDEHDIHSESYWLRQRIYSQITGELSNTEIARSVCDRKLMIV